MEGGTFETQQMCVAQGHVPRLQSEAASGLHRCMLCPLWFWSRYIFLLFRGSLPAKGDGGGGADPAFPMQRFLARQYSLQAPEAPIGCKWPRTSAPDCRGLVTER